MRSCHSSDPASAQAVVAAAREAVGRAQGGGLAVGGRLVTVTVNQQVLMDCVPLFVQSQTPGVARMGSLVVAVQPRMGWVTVMAPKGRLPLVATQRPQEHCDHAIVVVMN